LGGARNTGIRAAKGEFVGFLDADDQWLPDYLETMVSLTEKFPDSAVFYCDARYMDERGNELPQSVGVPAITPEKIYQTLLRANFIIPSTILAKRSVIVDEGLFDQNCRSLHGCEDWDLWLRIAPRYGFTGTSTRLVHYRMHGKSFSADPSHMQIAVRTVIEKHFGPDDGQPHNWTSDKRRAFGGVYRYHLLTSVRHKNDWQVASDYLCRALLVDPTLSTDLGLFYDLALGSQPVGYRGTTDQLDLENNAKHINILLNDVFSYDKSLELQPLRRVTFGTANHALGLVAYNTGQLALCRSFLMKALSYRQDLISNTLVMSNLVKSMVGRSFLEKVKKYSLRSRN
jgi:glycosyltransferase involved in cell wall biosynthesis